jgi:uncharacterized protein YfaP (DUF2135 family)
MMTLNASRAKCHAGGRPLSSNVRRSTNALPAVPTTFTPRQGQYLAFIYYYTRVNRKPPSEADIQSARLSETQ